MSKLIIKQCRVIDPSSGFDKIVDILIEDGKIAAIGEIFHQENANEINGEGLVCAPGIVDMHVHLRDPGFTKKEDIVSGCAAAAAGGVTSVLCMPNTSPAIDSPEIIDYIIKKAEPTGVHVYPVGAVTKGLKGQELCDYSTLYNAGAVAFSDDGRPVERGDFLREAMKSANALGTKLLCHCEDLEIVNGGIINKGDVSEALGVKGIDRLSEDSDTKRVIEIAGELGVPVHICHVSTIGSCEIIRQAKKQGIAVTAETAPHYFAYTDEKLLQKDADYRMNPPLRTDIDRQAIIEALCDGTIDAIATDHAPHTIEEKSDFLKSPNGSIGMETSLAASLTFLKNHMSLSDILKCMTYNPAKISGIDAGEIKIGAPADLVLFDLNESFVVDTQKLHGKSENAVFKNETLAGKVKYTVSGGKIVFSDGVK